MHTLVEIGLSNAIAATVLALVATLVGHTCRRPALAHSLWLLVLVKLVTPPLLWLPVPWLAASGPVEPAELVSTPSPPAELPAQPERKPGVAAAPTVVLPEVPAAPREADVARASEPLPEEPAGPPELPAVSAPVPAPVLAPASSTEWTSAGWTWWLVPLSLAGSLVWFARAALHIRRFRRLLRHARPASVELRDRVRALAQQLGLRRPPETRLIPGAVSPLIWAVGQAPCLLFPEALLERLDAEQQSALLVHELAHVRRGDHWVRLLELVVAGLYWWHPVVWWARRELHEAEEQCCDAWVVSSLAGAGRTYALALIEAITFVSTSRAGLPVAASGIGQVAHLRRRLTMILQGNTPRSLSRAGLVGVLGLGLLSLPLLPARSQQAASPRETRARQIQELQKELDSLIAWRKVEQDRAAAGIEPLAKPNPRDAKIDATERAIQALEELQRAEDVPADKRPRRGIFERPAEGEVRAQDNPRGGLPAADATDKYKSFLKELDDQIAEKQRELQDLQARRAKVIAMLKERPVDPNRAGGTGDGKSAEVEKKLDRLLREVEELKREIHGGPVKPTPPAADAPRTTPPENFGPPTPRPGAEPPPAESLPPTPAPAGGDPNNLRRRFAP